MVHPPRPTTLETGAVEIVAPPEFPELFETDTLHVQVHKGNFHIAVVPVQAKSIHAVSIGNFRWRIPIGLVGIVGMPPHR